MKIVIRAKNIELNQALRDWIHRKFDPLAKFEKDLLKKRYYNHFFGKGKPRVEMWVEIEKGTHHKKGDVFRAEAQMRFPGKSIRSEVKSHDLRLAITEVKDELQREIKKYKGKRRAIYERGARKMKKLLHLAKPARFKRKKGSREREEGV